MPDFLYRLLIVALIIFLLQVLFSTLEIRDPYNKALMIIALILGLIWILFGAVVPH